MREDTWSLTRWKLGISLVDISPESFILPSLGKWVSFLRIL
jgi:hypothetical protein